MNLYTEEDVRQMLKNTDLFDDWDIEFQIRYLTPIQLPSDEEIKKTFPDFDEFDPDDVAYVGGAIWMRDKIGGNK